MSGTTSGVGTGSINPKQWVGRASVGVISATYLETNVPYVANIKPTDIPVTWMNNETPDGTQNLTLASTFPPGYKVHYTVDYELKASIYWDGGDAWLRASVVDYPNQNSVFPDTILRPNVHDNYTFNYRWAYGSEEQPQYRVTNGVVPSRITFTFGKTGTSHLPYAIDWKMHFTVTVVRDCTKDNIKAPICIELCQASPKQCYVDYDQVCLQGDPDLIAKEPCKGFFSQYISMNDNGSTHDIDKQARLYCKSRYNGFADLFQGDPTRSPPISDADREADITICACHLSANDDPNGDPEATVLYDRYYNSLVSRFPPFAAYGASIQRKCLVPQCASSAFRPVSVPGSGCVVPPCLNFITIDNNGTVNGNIDASASCQSKFGGGGDNPSDSSFTIIILVIVVILIILIVVLYFYGRNRNVALRTSGNQAIVQQLS